VPGAKLAIFDLDGTLVDSRRDLAEAGNAARAALALPALAVEEVATFVGDGVEKLIERLTPGVDATARARATLAFRSAYRAGCTRWTRPYEGIAEALAALAADGWSLGVATNKPLEFTERILDACGIRGRFAGVRGGDRARKPDPTQLLELAASVGAHPGASWMIGDHRTDIAAGRAAGMRVAWCGWGIGRHDGMTVDLELAHPRELPPALAASAVRGAAGA
jgi:phosphoglycolate phosphatase